MKPMRTVAVFCCSMINEDCWCPQILTFFSKYFQNVLVIISKPAVNFTVSVSSGKCLILQFLNFFKHHSKFLVRRSFLERLYTKSRNYIKTSTIEYLYIIIFTMKKQLLSSKRFLCEPLCWFRCEQFIY